MSTAKRLAWIGVGYVLAAGVGCAAVAVNEMRISEEIQQTSPGMVAFGDMILFLFVTGFFSLAPTWFLLRLWIEKAPRTLLAVVLLIAAVGPVSWWAVVHFAGKPGDASPITNLPEVLGQLVGLFIAFAAIPRMVFGPVILVIETVTLFMFRGRAARALLATAMLLDIVPMSMFALHLARMPRY